MQLNYTKHIIGGLASVLFLLLLWGVVIEPRLVDFNEENAAVPNLPAEWEGNQIALLADLQIGMWLGNEGTVREIVNEVIEKRPSAVLIAGDFVYKPMDEDEIEEVEHEDSADFMNEINESVRLLSPLTNAGIPVYAVLGNHDYGMNHKDSVKNERLAQAVHQSLENAGIKVLDNAAAPIAKLNNGVDNAVNNTDFYVAGIGSLYAGNDNADAALAQIPENAPRVVFMHNPDSFAKIPANAAPLAIAGHTHGGQIRIPFTEDFSWMTLVTDDKVHADGWVDANGQAGNRLYVNRGIGFSSFPVRINCRPELTMFTLHRGNS